MRDIGKNIRDLRVRSGLTQEGLAERLFVTRQTISNYETGKTRPDVDSILRMAEVMDTDANTVFYGLPVPESKKADYKRLAIASVILVVMSIMALLLHPWCDTLMGTRYIAAPYFLLNLIFDPLLMLMLGWWLMNMVGFLLRTKSLDQLWIKKLRYIIIGVLVLSLLVLLPYSIWMCMASIGTGSHGAFPMIPVHWEMLQLLMGFNFKCEAMYTIFGAVLWLVGLPHCLKRRSKGKIKKPMIQETA